MQASQPSITGQASAAERRTAERYEIDVRPECWGLLRWVASHDGLDGHLAGRRCFAALHGRDGPCPECPVLAGKGECGKGVFRRSLEPLVLELVTARPCGGGGALVSVVPMDSTVLSALIGARIDALCEKASVTRRERAVLDLVTLGWAQRDIASALRITVRTVKYHEANVQAKLGADSRLDLMRLFL